MKYFRPQIRSRHPSHSQLRARYKKLPLFPFRSIIRLGSLTTINPNLSINKRRVELNSVEAIKNSSNKFLMKSMFSNFNVRTANWYTIVRQNSNYIVFKENNQSNLFSLNQLQFPLISKQIFGSRGRGNTKHNDLENLIKWLSGKTLSNYIFETYYNYVREYRLHVNKDRCFYTCRKMLKYDTLAENKWFRNDSNCVWIMDNNPLFQRPLNWKEIEKESILALKAVGLDFGAIDLRIQSQTDSDGNIRQHPNFIIVEINSAPSFGDVTLDKYIIELPKMLKSKYEQM